MELRILTGRRTDLVVDRTRAINRLRAQLLEYFPALERAFDYSQTKAALILLTGYQTPEGCAGPVQPDSRAGCANARPATPTPSRPPP